MDQRDGTLRSHTGVAYDPDGMRTGEVEVLHPVGLLGRHLSERDGRPGR